MPRDTHRQPRRRYSATDSHIHHRCPLDMKPFIKTLLAARPRFSVRYPVFSPHVCALLNRAPTHPHSPRSWTPPRTSGGKRRKWREIVRERAQDLNSQSFNVWLSGRAGAMAVRARVKTGERLRVRVFAPVFSLCFSFTAASFRCITFEYLNLARCAHDGP